MSVTVSEPIQDAVAPLKAEQFGQFVRDRRTTLGLTQQQLADRINAHHRVRLTQTRISTIEKGQSPYLPSPGVVAALARELRTSWGELMQAAGYVEEAEVSA